MRITIEPTRRKSAFTTKQNRRRPTTRRSTKAQAKERERKARAKAKRQKEQRRRTWLLLVLLTGLGTCGVLFVADVLR